MAYPEIRIDLNKIETNTRTTVERCHQQGIQVAGVTKLFGGNPEIATAYVAGGVDLLADSRIDNLKRLSGFSLPKMLLRIPMISEAATVVQTADMVLISEPETAKALSNQAKALDKSIQLILMVDVGDLREGLYAMKEIQEAASMMDGLPGVQLTGIGTNLTCYGGVRPSRKNLTQLVNIKTELEKLLKRHLPVLSGGNGGTLSLLETGEIPVEINQLRLGSSLAMGIGLNDEPIPGLQQDAFLLLTEIVELRRKPSIPEGIIGLDAFGNRPVFEDRGNRMRAICALGRQDIHPDEICPLQKGIQILGASSDHLILDVEDCSDLLQIGSYLTFLPTYGGCLSLMTSPYVKKIIIT
ncbi:alanine/ornithine racemase family PLP-dependent enzyme [Anoxynatronum buryatiense]|uniref:Predicted amino acid racemase n=1 Tax=Anoxynatronum buryatiense TaxID=489973 RepID=A0AA45WX21_9CLOT|nr:alanine/ornithine racemase family PLP-dependent enzyme [Anoxynatronum buryatiense]SMP61832.1 Predicted amino acid racemase [Anoxynatronum buryatiense]